MPLNPSPEVDGQAAAAAPEGRGASEAAFLTAYDPSAHPPLAVTVDLALLTIRAGRLAVVLVRRGGHPHRGRWALPGGFVHPDEDLDQAAGRELREETGLDVAPWHVEQLRTYGSPGRDPRMRVVSVAYLVFMPGGTEPTAGSDAAAARFWAVDDVWSDDGPELAFDHLDILGDAVERIRAKLEYTTLAASFLDEPFTLGELRRAYEAVWGASLHHPNFARKVLAVDDFVRPDSDVAKGKQVLYRRGGARLVMPPLMRPSAPS